MADICVIGGTRYFGRKLVRRLLDDGHRVTLVNRGRTPDPFGSEVDRRVADATDPEALAAAAGASRFDAVIHQMSYTPRDAVAVCEAFGDRAGKLVLTSTLEVYNKDTFRWEIPAPAFSAFASEGELDPAAYRFDLDLPWHDPAFLGANYGEGKRQTEAAVVERAESPVAVARVAHVLDAREDFTGRVQFHVDSIREGREIHAHPSPGRTSIVSTTEAAAALAWLATSEATGVVNVAAPDPIDVYGVCSAFEHALGRKAIITERPEPSGERLSPYSCPADFGMNVDTAAELGFEFTPTADWLPDLAREAAKEA